MSLTQTSYVDEETGREHPIAEPARPDLKPGETVTYTPDRYCLACEQARGTRRCPMCGGATLTQAEAKAAQAVPVHFDRPMGVTPPADDDDGAELAPDEALALLDEGAAAALELLADEPPPAPHHPRFVQRLDSADLRPQRGRVQPDGMVDNGRGRAQSAQNTRPEPQRYENPIPPRRKRVVHVAPLSARRQPQGAAAMERSNTNAARRPQRVQEVDEDGREVHRTSAARRGKSIEDMYDGLWADAKVDKAAWDRFAAAAASTPDYDDNGAPIARTPADAAAFADALYMERIAREKH